MNERRHHYIFPDGRQEWHPGLRIHCSICSCDQHCDNNGNVVLHVNHPNYVGRPKPNKENITEMEI